MKKKFALTVLIASSLWISCTTKVETKNTEDYKAEIFKAEKDFETTVAKKGIAEGFYQFADENATIKREQDTLITGKENIKKYYSNPKFKKASVTWKADFADVSVSGDLAYTYGKYAWTVKDSTGNSKTFKGVFHTVWKKQDDGNWKYVWD
ncbi:nuclear transport factor 2 family protein [Flavobacterium sp. SM15]|uniref:YybH family protein n=1 Tax=Flavobacterium sp. SM15 TaxID=2908005 RepID=UPI001EDA32CC|nr:nuclear transport factor 2 family protein [Flavobacterium sp. SM15]MCG2609900.1 nuclear transport factor 2 family protein [Flavobacterium sp. SM15]